jgi:hypothetical protein
MRKINARGKNKAISQEGEKIIFEGRRGKKKVLDYYRKIPKLDLRPFDCCHVYFLFFWGTSQTADQ